MIGGIGTIEILILLVLPSAAGVVIGVFLWRLFNRM